MKLLLQAFSGTAAYQEKVKFLPIFFSWVRAPLPAGLAAGSTARIVDPTLPCQARQALTSIDKVMTRM